MESILFVTVSTLIVTRMYSPIFILLRAAPSPYPTTSLTTGCISYAKIKLICNRVGSVKDIFIKNFVWNHFRQKLLYTFITVYLANIPSIILCTIEISPTFWRNWNLKHLLFCFGASSTFSSSIENSSSFSRLASPSPEIYIISIYTNCLDSYLHVL